MDIFIRPLKLRVGWVDISAGLPEQSLSPPQPHRWQPVIAGVGHVKATGVIMGPRFLKALVPDQGEASPLLPATPNWAAGSIVSGIITEQAHFAKQQVHHSYRFHWDALNTEGFDMRQTDHHSAVMWASLWQDSHQVMPLALDDPAINPTAQPASTRWVEFGIKMQKLYHAPGHNSPPALFFRLIFDANTYGNVGIGNVAMSLDASAFKGSTQPDILKLNGTIKSAY
ncbi:hypothetical protein C6P46_004131 [Rhodotorula mucilaginosa]|uniref:Uncharacterized protein n=1 Tax=Rhodotorula mucilaginosa TaxID=5537 RepID=A0A9P6W391_RHOMI|nr:hypothetical protein C6P46_004131 [Rhodotorula mucilaginosa]